MRAARFHGSGRISVERVPVPAPGAGEVLVEVHANALCGSDRHALRGGTEVIPGHEISGTVVGTGTGVDEERLGTRGVVYLVDACESCAACAAGSPNMCLRKRGAIGFSRDGGLAEHVRVPAKCFLPVPDIVPLDHATALLDLFGTTLHAFRRSGRDIAGADVAVMGCGPIGIGAVAVAIALGAGTVHACDVIPYRLELAGRMGATVVDGREEDVGRPIRERVPDGCSVVIEAAGTPETQRAAVDLCGPGGCVVIVAHSAAPLELRTSPDLIQLERALIGSEYFPRSDFGDGVELVGQGRLDPAPLLTHRFGLDEVEAAYDAFLGGATGKVLVLP